MYRLIIDYKHTACWLLLLLLPALQANSQSAAQLDSFFSTLFPPGLPGGAVLIAKKGKVIYKRGFGVADIVTRQPVTPRTIFNTGSISKTFVAYGILKLAQQGRISLQDPLSRFFPDFDNKSIADSIRICHLLTHSSGLPDSREVAEHPVFYLTATDTANFAPLKKTQQLHFSPGSQFEYSNPAFNGLALIIEKVSGQKWQQFIREQIFRPAGMQQSLITDGAYPQTGVAHGYIADSVHGYTEYDYGEAPTFAAAGNGGVWSNVEELWLYEQAIQQERLLDSSWLALSRKVYTFDNWAAAYPPFMGLSWFIADTPYRMIGHTGSQGGFKCDYQWLPDQQLCYILLANTPQPREAIREKLFTLLQVF
ncbi:serine hydrolase domain-containing protein [Chitinophaga nivalis]|uniref:Beta-lactamase family protein n=1 Tax=Chitinophaga nivalis TaxID=2991709 RepID=A0ABT3IK12_9BACT|nr:serine hydrolase domain-containing protein [Chitinophaga nivalis]MCW3466004.1 beta-lactamase family protein [Chitinophaga nivalis]MCW3484305.1 beta-lactamase family protein [Chitinophaga nivalis]